MHWPPIFLMELRSKTKFSLATVCGEDTMFCAMRRFAQRPYFSNLWQTNQGNLQVDSLPKKAHAIQVGRSPFSHNAIENPMANLDRR